MNDSRFAHHRLDAYRVALELFAGVERISWPRGHADLRDQLRRAAAMLTGLLRRERARVDPGAGA